MLILYQSVSTPKELLAERQLYAGFDGGGTKTTCVIVRSDGSVVGRGLAGPSNYHNVGLDGALDALVSSFRGAMSSAGIKRRKVEAACFGLAALDSKKDMEKMNRAVSSIGLAQDNLVVNDWRIALSGAFGSDPGIILIAGTGCVSAGQNVKSETVRVGGWGNVIDDRGSAYDIGRDALYAAMRAYDGRGPWTSLLGILMEELKLNEPQDLIERVHLDGMRVTDIASLCTLVGKAALDGDKVSREILKEKGLILSELVMTVAKRLGMLDDSFSVALNGGVFKIGRPILVPLVGALRASAPLSRVTSPRLSPACGAIVLLFQKEGSNINSRIRRLMSSSRKNSQISQVR